MKLLYLLLNKIELKTKINFKHFFSFLNIFKVMKKEMNLQSHYFNSFDIKYFSRIIFKEKSIYIKYIPY